MAGGHTKGEQAQRCEDAGIAPVVPMPQAAIGSAATAGFDRGRYGASARFDEPPSAAIDAGRAYGALAARLLALGRCGFGNRARVPAALVHYVPAQPYAQEPATTPEDPR